MPNVIQELSSDSEELDGAQVGRRVDDWQSRVSALYDQLSDWLPRNLRTDRQSTVPMHEDLMKKYGVPEIELPILNIFDGDRPLAKLVPRGLWIIGANGRLDLFARNAQWIIVDRAENFESPIWQIAPADSRRKIEPLTRDIWLRAVGL